jgi:hypothetical protein
VLANRRSRVSAVEEETQSEELLAARAERLRIRLPLTLGARSSQKVMLVALSAGTAAAAWWGYRIWHPRLMIAAAGLLAFLAYETARALIFRLNIKLDSFEVRSLWQTRVYGYNDLENVEPAQGGDLIIVMNNGKRIRCYVGNQNSEDIFLLLTDMVLAYDNHSQTGNTQREP